MRIKIKELENAGVNLKDEIKILKLSKRIEIIKNSLYADGWFLRFLDDDKIKVINKNRG